MPSSPQSIRTTRTSGEEGITPSGSTVIKEDDFVTIHSRSGITDDTLGVFTGTSGSTT